MQFAWESENVVWNDLAHGFGAFVLSPGFGGLFVLAAAAIAAYQVSETRKSDKVAATEDRAVLIEANSAEKNARRLDQLWSRFEWVTTADLGAVASVRALLAIRAEAKEFEDKSLLEVTRSFLDSILTDELSPLLIDPIAESRDNEGDTNPRK